MAIDFETEIDVKANRKTVYHYMSPYEEQRYALLFVNSSLLSAFSEWGRVAWIYAREVKYDLICEKKIAIKHGVVINHFFGQQVKYSVVFKKYHHSKN